MNKTAYAILAGIIGLGSLGLYSSAQDVQKGRDTRKGTIEYKVNQYFQGTKTVVEGVLETQGGLTISSGTIDGSALADLAITASKLRDGSVTTSKFGDGLATHRAPTSTSYIAGGSCPQLTGARSQCFGDASTGAAMITGTDNTMFGFNAGNKNTGSANTFFGKRTGEDQVANNDNSFFGSGAGENVTANRNTALGSSALSAQTSGADNTSVGANAASGATGNFSETVVVGSGAGDLMTTGADRNILLGYQAGNILTSGSGNIIICHDCDPPSATTNNYLSIDGLITGDFSAATLAINGTTTFESSTTTKGHIGSAGTAPAVTSCGTSPSITGTDTGGKVTVGSSASSTCTLTFDTAYEAAPACTTMNGTVDVPVFGTTTTTTLALTDGGQDFSSDVIMYICIGL